MITILRGLPILQHYEHLLRHNDSQSAWYVIEEFFRMHEEQECCQEIWMMLIGALSSDQLHDAQKGSQRHNLIFLSESLCVLLKAIHVLQQQKEKQP